MYIKKLITSLIAVILFSCLYSLIVVMLFYFLSFALRRPSGNPSKKIVEEEIKQEREQRNSADKIIFEGKYAEINHSWMKENNNLGKFIENKIRVKGGKVIKNNSVSEHNLNEWNYVRVKITQQVFLIPDIYSGIEVIGGKKIKVIIEIWRMKRIDKDSAIAEEIFAIGESVIISNNPVNEDKEKAVGIALDNLWILK